MSERQRRKKDPAYLAKRNAYEKKRYAKYQPKIRDQVRQRMYGITPEQREAIVRRQGGVCAICRRAVPLTVDHCHLTGAVRGLLCNNCNPMLGFAKDNPEVLRSAIEYLSH